MRDRLKAILGVGTAVAAVGGPFIPTPVVSVPVGDIVAPAVALSVLRRILRTRSEQIGGRFRPRELSASESLVLAGLTHSAMNSHTTSEIDVPPVLPAEVRSLLTAVESPEQDRPRLIDGPWEIIVRVFGEPVAESRESVRAVFGKRRSIELLSWMVLNRDRLSRTAARTAMWDFQVADSTFGTILSDLRRGLSRLAPAPTVDGWCPATFTDRLILADGVVSDVELLQRAITNGDKNDLVRELVRVRDVPFAGTSYLWADLDGTTTRTVITVLDAVDRLARIGSEEGDTHAVRLAVKAGLRVMPGDEELLRIQSELLRRQG